MNSRLTLAVLIFLGVPTLSAQEVSSAKSSSISGLLCQDSAGSILIRKKCKKTETRIDSSTIGATVVSQSPGLLGSAGPAGEQGPQGIPGQPGNQGPTGAKGQLNLSACRAISTSGGNFLDAVPDPVVYAGIDCAQATEFLLEDSVEFATFNQGSGVLAFMQARSSTTTSANGQTFEYGVEYSYDRAIFGTDGKYLITVTAICCPRT